MKKKRPSLQKLAANAAMLATISILNRCLEKKDISMVKRGDAKSLNRKLNLVNIVYHTLGIFYNE
jgi:hypothetical protein